MPNWVYNTVNIEGSAEDITKMLEVMSQPIPTQRRKAGSLFEDEQGVWDMVETDFSFWNVVAPPQDKWGEYFTTSGTGYNSTEYNWYGWNIGHWGTKWDASDVDIDRCSDDNVIIRMETAWSYPLEFMVAFAEQFPTLTIDWGFEEEQGWGGEREYQNGELIASSDYDIPESHADYVNRGRDCSFCEWGEPAPDCPDYVDERIEVERATLPALQEDLTTVGTSD